MTGLQEKKGVYFQVYLLKFLTSDDLPQLRYFLIGKIRQKKRQTAKSKRVQNLISFSTEHISTPRASGSEYKTNFHENFQ
jgi:hypothetical protein